MPSSSIRPASLLLFALLALLGFASLSLAGETDELPKPWWAVDDAGSGNQQPAFGLNAQEKKYLQKSSPKAFLRSMVLPGWGQRYGERPRRAALYTGLEVGLWTGLILSRQSAIQGKDHYITFARQHAGVRGDPDHEYYVNIGNFLNQDAYNTAKRLQRSYDEQYHGTNTWWEWDSNSNRAEFKDMRITADRHANRVYYLIGGLLLNRVISAIDAGQGLAKRQKELRSSNTISLGYDPVVGGPSLTWSGNLGF